MSQITAEGLSPAPKTAKPASPAGPLLFNRFRVEIALPHDVADARTLLTLLAERSRAAAQR